jgi:hypothetical protein
MKFSQEFLKESLSPGAEKKRKRTEKKMSEEFEFVKEEGVAHAGPGFKNVSHSEMEAETDDVLNTGVFRDENESEKDLKVKFKKGKRFEKKTGGIYPKFLSKTRNYIANMPTAWVQSKKNVKTVLEKKIREENLKTMSESKKERKIRGEIREILHDPKNYIPPSEKNPLDVMAEE